ncbi:MAG: ABC transporter ATP-binding protein [Candidatus Dojkabacteria bacterium]
MSLLALLRKYFSFIAKDKWRYLLSLALLFLYTLTLKAGPYLFGLIVDALNQEQFQLAMIIVAAMVASKILGTILGNLTDVFIDRVMIQTLMPQAKLDYVDALQHMDLDYHNNKSSGSLISLAKRGENSLITLIRDINVEALSVVFDFVITIIILTLLEPSLGLAMSIVGAISFLASYQLMLHNIRQRKRFNKVEDKITGLVVDNMIGYETIKIFTSEKWEHSRLKDAYEGWKKRFIAYANSFIYIDFINNVIPALGFLVIFALGISSLERDVITIGLFVTAMSYVFDVEKGIKNLIYKLRNLAKVYADVSEYFQIMDLKPGIQESISAKELKQADGAILYSDVSFKYKDGSGEVLSGINIAIEPKETIALVGESGGGKTTFTKLLMRFYDVSSGVIMLDGVDIRELKLKDLRSAIGLVPQDPVLFNESVGFNIAYGRKESSLEEIKQSAKLASLDKFIESLPDGYDTIVGERGVKLSGGQKQRLAIARVILEDPSIIIFDEATSQLDSLNEQKIQEAFHNLTRNKTTIVIAHRLSTIVNSDRILVFDKGEIVEQGDHKQLIEKNGIYAKLWKMQTKSAR